MPENKDQFKVYESGGEYYKIDPVDVDAFKADIPDAKELTGFVVGKDTFNIGAIVKQGKVSDFISDFPDAKPMYASAPKAKTPPMAEMPTLADRRSRSAQVGTELAAKEKIQKETTKAFNATVVGAYDAFQKEAKDAMEANKDIIESNVGNKNTVLEKASKYPTSKFIQGIAPATGGMDLANTVKQAEANAIAIKADVADKRSRAAEAKRNLDELFMPTMDKAVKEGVENFYKEGTFQEGAKLADPNKVQAFVDKIITDSGAEPGDYSREYLYQQMIGKVDAAETIKKQTEIADREFEKKYGVKPNEVYKVAEQAKLELDASANSLMIAIEAEREVAINQVAAPIQKAIKDSESGLKQYYDQYTGAFQLLQAEVTAGRMPVDQAQAQLDQLNAQRAERERVYQAEVDQYAQQYEAVQKTINSKFSSRLTRQYAEIEQAAKDKIAKFYKEGQGLDPAIINDYKDMFERAGEATKKLKYIEATAAKSPIILDVKEYGMTLVNGLGNSIKTFSDAIGWDGGKILGDDMARTFVTVSPEIESGWDLLKPGKFAASAGYMTGNMAPQILAQAALAKLTIGLSATARLAITGSVGMALETTQIASAARSEEFARSGDVVKADKAAEIVISDNLKDWYLYTVEGIPFLKNITLGIKGKGILPTLGRTGLKSGIEVFSESIQEIRQTGAEERARLTVEDPMEKEVRLANFSKIIRNNMYMDSNGKDLKSGQTPYTTFLNVLPSTMLMGGFGEVSSYVTNKTAYAAGSVAALKNRFSEVSENFHAQYMYDMFLRKGENFTAGYITTLNRQGLISDQQFANITAQFDKLAEVRDIAARTKMSAGSSKVLFALQNDLDNKKNILDNAQTEVEREMAEVKYNAAKANLSSFVSGKNPDYVVMQLRSGEQYVATYDEFEQLLNTPSFINDAKDNIRVAVIGSGKTTGGLTLSTELKKKLGIITPTPEEQAAIQEQGTPLQEILGNTEQPYVNAMIENLDQRMANAEEIPTSDMNAALEGLYAQLDLIYNNHFGEPSGKAAAKIITDKIDQLQNYEFKTDKETQIIAETAAVQTARNAVEQELSTIQIAGRREQPGKPARRATVTLEDGTTANYTIRVDDGNVTLNPVSGSPLTMGDARSVNESMGFVESKMGANGMPTSVTFTMQGTAAERGRKTVTLSTANGYTQEELLDIAINLRAKEIGTVDPTAFDEAFRIVSQQEVETTVFPNIPAEQAPTREAAPAREAAPVAPAAEAPVVEQAPAPTAREAGQTQPAAITDNDIQNALNSASDEEYNRLYELSRPNITAETKEVEKLDNEGKLTVQEYNKRISDINLKYKEEGSIGVYQAYYNAKQNNSNPKLVEAVEDLARSKKVEQAPAPTAAPTAAPVAERLLPVQVQERVDRIAQSIRSLGVTVDVISDPTEWNNLLRRLNAPANTQGVFMDIDGKVYLNADLLVGKDGDVIAFHEGTHPIINVIRNTNKPLFDRLVAQGLRGRSAPGEAGDVISKMYADASRQVRSSGYTPEQLAQVSLEDRVNDELVTELIARIAAGDIDINKIPRSLLDTVLEFVNEIAKLLGLPQITTVGSAEARRTMTQIANALRTGADITGVTGQVGREATMFTAGPQARAVAVFEGALERLGIDIGVTDKKGKKKRITNFDVAKALSKFYKKQFGSMRINDFGKKAVDVVSDYATDEIIFALAGADSGLGWYTTDFAKAIDILKNFDPDIADNQEIRDVATVVIAIASNSTDVESNLTRIVYGINEYKKTGKVPTNVGVGTGSASIAKSIETYNKLVDLFGGVSQLKEFMMTERTVAEAKKALMDKAGVSTWTALMDTGLATNPGWNDNEVLPSSIILFGPKIGAFWSNLAGLGGTPTIDRWCIRTIYRYRGDMRAKVLPKEMDDFIKENKLEGQSKGSVLSLIEAHSKMFNAILTGRGEFKGLSKDERNKLLKPYRKGSGIWKKMSGVVNDIKDGLTEKIDNIAQYEKDFRSFTKKAFIETQRKVNEKLGINLEISDVQAILWLYEKKLFGHMGVKQDENATYSAAAQALLDRMNNGVFTLDNLKAGKVSVKDINSIVDDGAMGDNYATPVDSFSEGLQSQPERLNNQTPSAGYQPSAMERTDRMPQPDVFRNNIAPEIERIKSSTEETGATINLDGTPYTGGGLVVPAGSLNVPQDQISADGLLEFINQNSDKISSDIFKVGLYKFPNRPEVSYDLNIVIPNQYRDVAIEFGRLAGQESLFDLDTFENVKTGSDGKNPMSFNADQLASIAQDLSTGTLPRVVTGQLSAMERGDRGPLSSVEETTKALEVVPFANIKNIFSNIKNSTLLYRGVGRIDNRKYKYYTPNEKYANWFAKVNQGTVSQYGIDNNNVIDLTDLGVRTTYNDINKKLEELGLSTPSFVNDNINDGYGSVKFNLWQIAEPLLDGIGSNTIKIKESNPEAKQLGIVESFISKGPDLNKASDYISKEYHQAKQDGSNPDLVKAVEDIIGGTQAQLSAMERGDRVSGTYYEPHLTTDENGNYVFFHVSTAPERNILKGIDSRKFTSLRTSREEKGLQYGVASFYTKPDDGERMVGGDKYYVTVAPDKVYPMDADPNGYRTAAEKKIKPGTPFREEKIRKAVAEAATKDGFEMAVGEWAYDATGMTSRELPAMRGDALTVMKPKVYTGDENFQTGMDRGINTPHPMQAFYRAKMQLNDIADSVKSELAKRGKYDDAYDIARSVADMGGIVENYGEPNESVRDLTAEEFNTLYDAAGKANKAKLDEIRPAYLGMQGQASIGFVRRMATNERLLAILPGVNLTDLRGAIKKSPTSFYTPQKFSEIRDRLNTMTDAELLAEIDFNDSQSLLKIFTQTNGPVSGLAFIEYINRMTAARDQALANNDQQLADAYEQNLKFAYESMEAFSTKIAQVLRQLGEVKSALNPDREAELYVSMIEKLLYNKGAMISDQQRDDILNYVKESLKSKSEYKALFDKIANDPNATQDDIDLLNIAQANMMQAELALGLYVGYLSPRVMWNLISGWIKGNLVSLRTVFLGLISNYVSFKLIRMQNILMGIISDFAFVLNKAGANTYGLEKYGLFSTAKPSKSAAYVALPITLIYDAIKGLTKASIAIGRAMTGRESFSDYMARSPFASSTLNILKYGASAMDNSSIIEYDQASHPIWNMQRAIGRGPTMEIKVGNQKLNVQKAFKISSFNKWLDTQLPPGTEYNELPADEKKRLRDAFIADQNAMMPNVSQRFLNGTEAFFSWNAEINFRLIAMSDVLPKEYARRVEFDRLAGNMGLNDVQRQLFIKDPLTFLTSVQTNMSPEMVDWWMDNIAEMTATKDTGIGMASMAAVNLAKQLPDMIAQKMFKGRQYDIPLFRTIMAAYATGIDTIVPFVRIPMNFTSFALDFVVPYKSLAKAAYFAKLAHKNRGTDAAEPYAMSSAKYVSRAVIGYALQNLAIQLLSIPGMVIAGSPKDDDEEEKKIAKDIPRNSVNVDALWRYVKGEDPTYKDGDQFQSMNAFGVLGLMLYSYAAQKDSQRERESRLMTNVPKNVKPEKVSGVSEVLDATRTQMEQAMEMSFGSLPYFIDQSWFVGVSSLAQAITDPERGLDKFLSTWTGSVLAAWWGFSSHAQQLSDMYRETTGKPVSDIRLTGQLKNVEREGYPTIYNDFMNTRFWNTVWGKNELIHKYMVDSQMDVEYISYGVYGRPITPVIGKKVSGVSTAMSIVLPTRAAIPDMTDEMRFYFALYKNPTNMKVPGYTMSLAEPGLEKTATISIPGQDKDVLGKANDIPIIIPPKDYNTLVPMAGKITEKLHAKLLEPYMNMEVRGKKITPEMIMDPQFDNVKEVVEIRRGMGVAISEANRIVSSFLKPWELLRKDEMVSMLDMDTTAMIAKAVKDVESRVNIYKSYDVAAGKMDDFYVGVLIDEQIAKGLSDLAAASIDMYVREAKKAIALEGEWDSYTKIETMTPEQERKMKEGYRRK